ADEVVRPVGVARPGEQIVERLDELRRELLPHEHGPRHVHVRRVVARQVAVDLVREVLVARDDADVELEPRLLLELRRVPLDARDVGVRVGPEEADARHARASSAGSATAPAKRSRASRHAAASSGLYTTASTE